MRLAIFHAIMINLSRPLEALFDELEYRSAKRVRRRVAKLKMRRSRRKVHPNDAIPTSSKTISVRTA